VKTSVLAVASLDASGAACQATMLGRALKLLGGCF